MVKCIRRQNILREPTPPPIDAEDEDSATSLLKHRTRFAATVVRSSNDEPHIRDSALEEFAFKLDLLPTNSHMIESKLVQYKMNQSLNFITTFSIGVEKSWSLILSDRLRRHFGQRENARKRVWSDAFRPLNFDSSPPTNIVPLINGANRGKADAPFVVKPAANHGFPLHSPSVLLKKPLSEVSMSVANLAKLELADAGSCKTSEWANEASTLTSEVAFWLRHLKPTMARTLTTSTVKDNTSEATKGDESSSPESSDGEVPTRWPGIDSIMVLYMAHQQGSVNKTYCTFLNFTNVFRLIRAARGNKVPSRTLRTATCSVG